MKVNIHRSGERGHSNHGWLDSHFSFSFADYFNRNRLGFGALRVLNDDVIAPSSGFPMHPHDNFEIVTIVTEGAVEHKDSMGNGSVIKPGDIQRMSAGSGVVHSEWNPSKDETLRLFQIWIKTRDRDVKPEYEQHSYDLESRKGEFVTLVSGDSSAEGLTFHQNAWIKRGIFKAGDTIKYSAENNGDGIFLFVVEGALEFDGNRLDRRDDASVSGADTPEIMALTDLDLILMEVPLNV